MLNNNDSNMEADIESGKSNEPRRKRINRMKTMIVIIAILFLILPTIFCIILSIQVNRLQAQMKQLMELHSQYGLIYEEAGSTQYAYAAEQDSDIISTADEDIQDIPSKIDEPKGQGSPSTEGKGNDNLTEEKGKGNLEEEKDNTSLPEENETSASQGKDNEADSNSAENAKPIEKNVIENDDKENDVKGNDAKENDVKENDVKGNDAKENDDKEDNEDVKRYAGKKVYLTFDDGPSIYTDEILDILKEYGVKATFFVVGKTDKASKRDYKRIVKEGHTLGMHSYSHKYDIIYNSLEDFEKDFTKLSKLLYDTTGYKPSIYRFPGGSDNLVNRNSMEDIIRFLKDASIVYYDWNVLNGDATGVEYTKKELIANILGGVKIKKTSIVLMHDSQTKKTTVESLPELLEELISGGAQLLPLDNEVTPIQMIKADSIK